MHLPVARKFGVIDLEIEQRWDFNDGPVQPRSPEAIPNELTPTMEGGGEGLQAKPMGTATSSPGIAICAPSEKNQGQVIQIVGFFFPPPTPRRHVPVPLGVPAEH